MSSPVLFLVFNRPESTARVFSAIRRVAPSRLYIAADGPRPDRAGETEKCAAVRNIVKNVNWDCRTFTLFRPSNLGCGKAVSSAISWFFEHEESGIILEDDTLPSVSFFHFASELLDRYKDAPRIMSISGSSFFRPLVRRQDYTFTNYADMWGWATWRRAWLRYDFHMQSWPNEKLWFGSMFERQESHEYWQYYFSQAWAKEIDTWDYQWIWAVMRSKGLCITPYVNMISNVGFGADATHTFNADWAMKDRALEEMKFPMRHPVSLRRNATVERYIEICRLGVPRRRLTDQLVGRLRRAIASRTTYSGKL